MITLCNHCVSFLEGKAVARNYFCKTYAKRNVINSKKPIGAFVWSDCKACYEMIGKEGWFVQIKRLPKKKVA